MLHPAPPWRLQGEARVHLQLRPLAEQAAWLPPGLVPVPVAPGAGLSLLYLASYGAGSSLHYHELIAMSGLVRWRGRIGGWISHIYVDDPASQAGGRAIWGLPKELAEFAPEPGGAVAVRRDGRLICRWQPAPSTRLGPLPLLLPVLNRHRGFIVSFTGRGWADWRLGQSRIEVGAEGPLAELGFARGVALTLDRLRLVIPSPRAIASAAP